MVCCSIRQLSDGPLPMAQKICKFTEITMGTFDLRVPAE